MKKVSVARSDSAAPLFSRAGVPVALVLALVLVWPVVWSGHLNGSEDTGSYLAGGDAIWQIVREKLAPASDAAMATAETGHTKNIVDDDVLQGNSATLYGRSITYTALFGAVVRSLGPLAMTYLQTLMVAFAILAMIGPSALQRRTLLVIGTGLLIVFGQVAWLSTYLMPDVLGAIVLIFAALLVARFDQFSVMQKWAITLLAAFAVSSHYGNMPVAFATVGAAMLWRYLAQRFGRTEYALTRPAVAAALFVVLSAPILNVVASFAVLGEASIAPMRPPVMLARSIEDGPARWYLEKQCAENPDDYCAAFDEKLMDKHYEFLWGEKGLDARDPEAAQSVRNNEWKIVLSAALEYPAQQLVAVIQNTVKQFGLVGEVGRLIDWNGSEFSVAGVGEFYSPMVRNMTVVTAISGLCLIGLLIGKRLTRSQIQILLIITFGLIVNAMVFGALSAPAPRYQARVAWLVPLLLVLFLSENGLRADGKIKSGQGSKP